jgi:hypothetical protein
MRYWISLCITSIALLAPTSLYCQSEPAAQTGNTAPPKQTQKATPRPSTGKSPKTPVTPSLLTSSYKPGQSLIVRLNNQRERVGKLSEIQSDYFLLTSSRGTEKIAYENVDGVRKWSVGWRVKKTLMIPVNPPLCAAVWIGDFLNWTTHR